MGLGRCHEILKSHGAGGEILQAVAPDWADTGLQVIYVVSRAYQRAAVQHRSRCC